jgi:hypothetical protein
MAEPGTGRLWRIHAGLVIASVLCVTAFALELWRALGGNALSWAYVFEWPLLLAYAVYMWQRLVREARGEPHGRLATSTPEEAAALEAWNEHLAALHAADAAKRFERGAR